ncbi:hypothetical protein BT63DRAFT_43380 [Microthyrium microscopicum]|uniref:Sialidase n=1 Tax=Microthyrium microscopicum TaxID=703497 RepID=A0A6A6U0P7_9PEZI|nr:hypothetical protein BT63DRAFT_43380 [Microthyrium microscopicum]
MYSCNMPVRHSTPPSYPHQAYYHPSHTVETHYSHPAFYSSNENSPDSVLTTSTSPQRSPRTNFRNGPPLLPKIRCQDQTTEPSSAAGSVNGRAVSLGVAPTLHTAFAYPPHFYRRGTTPPEAFDIHSPASAISLPASVFSGGLHHSALTAANPPAPSSAHPLSAAPHIGSSPSPLNTNINSPIATHPSSRRSSLAQVRTVSAPIIQAPNHSRSGSQSSLDEAALLKHGYPTQYRKMPQYITAPQQVSPVQALSVQPLMQTQRDPLDVYVHDDGSYMSTDMSMNSMIQAPAKQTSLMTYLTQPSPRPSLINRSMTDMQRHWDFGWWDVRNLRSWNDFSIDSILAIPGFNSLLNVPLDHDTLPHPAATNSNPETEFHLRDIYKDYFGTRINAALSLTQGARHLALRAANSATTHHYPKPDFIATHENDYLRTLRGDARGHLVGIVKAYEEWNTGMRAESAPQQVKYLRGLAQLHRVMREHGCRYGFIITEIELLCVRAGCDDTTYASNPRAQVDEGPRPIFGLLETAAPISLQTPAVDPPTGRMQMTATLALWFLHMLAKDEPLPGHAPWKMEVGGPAALTRQNFRARDGWMPKVVASETRSAKRLRGWIYPNEPFSRREAPNSRRRRA